MTKIKEAVARWRDVMTFEGEVAGKPTIIMDASPEGGGRNLGPTPMELFLLGVGGCSGMDIISMLQKMRQNVTSYQINVRGEQTEEHPTVYTSVTVEHVVRGKGISEEAVKRAVKLSRDKYCPAAATLEKTGPVTFTYRVEEE